MAASPNLPDVSLERLPQELLVRIASFLTTAELGPLRGTCKNIERQLFDTFAREFFTKRQFMIEHESLEALVGISRHPGLASKLSEVIIGTDMLMPEEVLLNSRALNSRAERSVLLSTGLACEMLVEAFSNLPNLRTIGLRDYSGTGRFRDGESARWRSWGWSLSSGTRRDGSDGLLPLILVALAQSKARPTDVAVFLRRHPQLRYDDFQLPAGPRGIAVASVLAELRTLMLAISGDGSELFQLSDSLAPWNVYNDKNFGELPLRRFLQQTPKLEVLRLNFENDQFFGHRIIDWLGRPVTALSATRLPSDLPTPPVQLGSLETLDLGMTNVNGGSLVRVLTKFDLESINLWKVTLQCPGPTSTSQDCWAEFLLQLSTSLPASCRIRYLMIGSCDQFHYTQTQPSSYGYRAPALRFVPEGTDRAGKIKAIKDFKIAFKAQYTGKPIHQWLRDKSELTFVPGIHSEAIPTFISDSESDSELDGEEDAMDEEADEDDNDGEDDVQVLSD
ncbi:Putative F-box domain-containing protein [Septoria linicola]|uniref:F-box domain-containing protein n=1 Tax=Septoria linicola TaxID=215465 RepID=A0A9Q9EKN1_9PEZI|nr:Putative F-box domain-containing protein [Septoria linicola]